MVSPLVAQAILGNKGPDIVGSFQRGREDARRSEVNRLSGMALKGEEGAFEALQGLDPQISMAIGEQIGAGSARDLNNFIRDAGYTQKMLRGGNTQGALSFVSSRLEEIKRRGGNTKQTQEIFDLLSTGQDAAALENLTAFTDSVDGAKSLTAEMQNRQQLIGDLDSPDERIRRSAEIALGLQGRAGQVIDPEARGDVKEAEARGQVIGTVGAEAETVDVASETEATMAERRKFGELQGSSRAKAIDDGFDRIGKIDTAIGNLDEAIDAVEGGAGTGALQRFLPSFKASSVALDQIQNKLALDVISGVTLGAISESELDLAKQVALPKGLDGPELLAHLEARKAAQEKLRGYFQEQIDFLDQGGTVAGFVRQQKRKASGQSGPSEVVEEAAVIESAPQRVRFDAQGNISQ